MKRYIGVREIEVGVYEINFRPYKKAKRVFKRIKAESMQEAAQVRATEMVNAQKLSDIPQEERERLSTDFSEVWEKLHSSLLSENRPHKTILRYQKTFKRMFTDFRELKFSYLEHPGQLSIIFLEEYKNYYCVELNRPRGWRAELIIVKAILKRMFRFGYCEEGFIKRLDELKKPRATKKEYPNIPKSKIKELLLFIKKDRCDFYKIVYFVLRTGRRIEETTLIERKDIVWNGIYPIRIAIRAETTKMNEQAPLDIVNSEMQNFLRQAYRDSSKHKSPYLFQNRRGKKCNQRRVCEYLKSVSEKILGIRITPHYFRHRFFTECGKNNLPMADAMAISGLKDSKVMIGYYSHSTKEGKEKIYEMTKFD